MRNLLWVGMALALAAEQAGAQSVESRNGVLADAAGRTLYTFSQDAPNSSHCSGPCAAAWPPFLAKEGERARDGFGVIVRDDGSRQWALDGRALYYYAADVHAGDVKGDGQGGVWHAIRRGAQPPRAPAGAPTGNTYGY